LLMRGGVSTQGGDVFARTAGPLRRGINSGGKGGEEKTEGEKGKGRH